jgi:hypothetical protein
MKVGKLLLALSVIALLSSEIIGVGQSGNSRRVSLRIRNLPAAAAQDRVFIKVIKLEDSSILSVFQQSAPKELVLNIPATQELLIGTYFTLSPPIFYQGSVGSYSGKSMEMTMENAARAAPRAAASFPTHPPAHGKAIGYNPDDFTVSGPKGESWLNRSLMDVAVCYLAEYQCDNNDENSYITVESANPYGMAKVLAELNLERTPGFDPESVVTPHIIGATHLVKGGFVLGEETITANLRLEDSAGQRHCALFSDWIAQGLARSNRTCRERNYQRSLPGKTVAWHSLG